MDITRRCDYACRILRAAYRSGESRVPVSDVAEEESIPYAFARSIQHELVKAGLIKTVRGAHGGFALSCDPSDTTILDVLQAVQGPVSVSSCAADDQFCEKSESCLYNKVWRGADHLLNEYFSKIMLEGLFDKGVDHPAIKAAMAFDLGSCDCSDAASDERPLNSEKGSSLHASATAKEPCA